MIETDINDLQDGDYILLYHWDCGKQFYLGIFKSQQYIIPKYHIISYLEDDYKTKYLSEEKYNQYHSKLTIGFPCKIFNLEDAEYSINMLHDL